MKLVAENLYKSVPVAISTRGDQLSVEMLNDLSARVSEIVPSRSLIFILCENSIGALAAYLSCIETDNVPMMLDARISADSLAKLTAAYKPNFIWAPKHLHRGDNLLSFQDYVLLPKCWDHVRMDSRLALLLQTSGTTGDAKTVRLSANNIRSNADAIAKSLNIGPCERPLVSLPLNYSYGISIVNSHVIKGATILLSSNSVLEHELWNFASTQHATSFAGVPYTYEMLLRLNIFERDLPELKTWTQAGGKLPEREVKKIAEECARRGKKFFVMYGQTEASPRMSVLPAEYVEKKPWSIGKPISCGKFLIAEDGELIFSGSNVALGYAESAEDLSRGDDFGGTLRTGDLAECDVDGFYKIIGRKSRFSKIFGNRVNLDSIESVAQKIIPSGTGTCACVCAFDAEEKILIFTDCADERVRLSLPEELEKFTRLNRSAFCVEFSPEIPRNPTGKVDYKSLAKGRNCFVGERVKELTQLHMKNCAAYGKIVHALRGDGFIPSADCADAPFLPARLFKSMDLRSVPAGKIVRTLTSSGTSGQIPSKIFLDAETASAQARALSKIVRNFLGDERLPMLIIDSESTIKKREEFSARAAAIVGFSLFGTEKVYALDEDLNLDVVAIKRFAEKHAGEKIFLFGFTSVVWKHFFSALPSDGFLPDFSGALMIHGGGWKSLEDAGISEKDFRESAQKTCGILPQNVRDYYGMAEQTGSIFMECECGHLHASEFSDIIIRRAQDFSAAGTNERGLVETISTLPTSYPGHAILTEDEGMILGNGDCPCGLPGKYFQIFGRLKKAEIRGCSDTIHTEAGQEKFHSIKVSPIADCKPEPIFSAGTIDFLDALSKSIFSDVDAKKFPDLVAFAFFCRRSNLLAERDRYTTETAENRAGLGKVFHIAPSNVPMNFAYSLVAGLLSGNANVVRLSSITFPQVQIFERILDDVLKKFESMWGRIKLLHYPREDGAATALLSSDCAARVIWGGDDTIAEVCKYALRPGAKNIAFGDRYSLAAFDADSIDALSENDMRLLAEKFYNDTFVFDQNACTSPQLVLWVSRKKNVSSAREKFWREVYLIAKKLYVMQPVLAVGKLETLCRQAAEMHVRRCATPDNLIVRVEVDELSGKLPEFRAPGGYFTECVITSVDEFLPFISDKMQVVSQFGLSEKDAAKLSSAGLRVVPAGATLDFSFVWDGVDLIRELSH